MSSPTEQSRKALKRLGRYLCGRSRLVYTYRRQNVSGIDVYVDTDWAGCVKTRKSTSGGAVMLGKHTIKHWSSTQPSVSLSSGEAEFYGLVRGSGQGLGYQALLRDLGLDMPLRLWTDSSAAIGICSRQGLGKLRHIDTHTLWVQQAVRSKRLEIKKVLGEENPADLLTKHSLSKERLDKLVELFDCHFKDGRAETAPQTRTGLSDKRTIAEADATVANVQERSPRMPHVELSVEQLEEQYPSLEAVEDLDLPDLSRLEDEQLYAAGMRVVQDILNEMSEVGRTRKQGLPGDSKENRYPVQPRVSRHDGLPRSSQGDEETRRRSVGALKSGAFMVKRQAPRPHVGVDAEGSPGGSWMEAARPSHERGRPADAGREHNAARGSGSGGRALGDSKLGRVAWHLPLCGGDDFNRSGAEESVVEYSQARGSQIAKEESFSGSTDVMRESSQVKSSYPESDRFHSLCGFHRFPRRRVADGASYSCSEVLPDQVSTEQVGNL